jgi:hypothetical protein
MVWGQVLCEHLVAPLLVGSICQAAGQDSKRRAGTGRQYTKMGGAGWYHRCTVWRMFEMIHGCGARYSVNTLSSISCRQHMSGCSAWNAEATQVGVWLWWVGGGAGVGPGTM